jgi:hypothetical protein
VDNVVDKLVDDTLAASKRPAVSSAKPFGGTPDVREGWAPGTADTQGPGFDAVVNSPCAAASHFFDLFFVIGCPRAPEGWERVSRDWLGDRSPRRPDEHASVGGSSAGRGPDGLPATGPESVTNPDAEAFAFVRFCYRRRAVAWPELYDEMCAVAAHGDYRGLTYEQLEGLGIRFVLRALPALADMAARVIAEERGQQPNIAMA